MFVGQVYLPFFAFCTLAPRYVLADRPAFLLRQGAHDGNQQLTLGVHGVNILFFEEHFDALIFQLANRRQCVDRVSCKAGDALRNDQIDLSRQRVRYHAIETVALFRVRAGDALVGIHFDHRPVWVSGDLAGIIIDLRFEARKLLVAVG
ncbi:hypothetical protein SDC9_110643 [bioreactor metagenome]|uniref:Uncharacterized protein n=1 Tax=bioreactor metagenome TaxID=1076179 RepID=A0A645BE83_9ZZZZ